MIIISMMVWLQFQQQTKFLLLTGICLTGAHEDF